MAIAIDSLVPLVSPEVPSCPDATIKQALQLAAQDFFRDTELWRIEDDPITTINESVIQLGIPTNTTLLSIYTFTCNDQPIDPTLPDIIQEADPGWITKTNNQISGYWIVDPDSVRIYPILNATGTIRCYFSVMPTIINTQLPDLVKMHVQTLSAGAKWKLQSELGKPWSNENRATFNGGLFNSLCIQAKIRATRQGAGGMQVKFRRA